jgi:hypothetical protein
MMSARYNESICLLCSQFVFKRNLYSSSSFTSDLHLLHSKWKLCSEINFFQNDFLNDCSSRRIIVVEATALGCFLTSWHIWWSPHLFHWCPWLLFLWVFTLKPFWGCLSLLIRYTCKNRIYWQLSHWWLGIVHVVCCCCTLWVWLLNNLI